MSPCPSLPALVQSAQSPQRRFPPLRNVSKLTLLSLGHRKSQQFESKSNRVKGIAFHPRLTLLAASLHSGSIQLWNFQMGVLVDRFEEHDGEFLSPSSHSYWVLSACGVGRARRRGGRGRGKERGRRRRERKDADPLCCFYENRTRPRHFLPLDSAIVLLWWRRLQDQSLEVSFFSFTILSLSPLPLPRILIANFLPSPLPSPSNAPSSQQINSYKTRRCLFTLHGHLDYVRSVYFHHEHPWILSASDDQTIRIWNWQSRQCIAILTGHNHYIM